MDIARLSMSMANSSMQSKVGMAVLDKALESEEALGAGMVQMLDSAAMERSVDPTIGANFDMRDKRLPVTGGR